MKIITWNVGGLLSDQREKIKRVLRKVKEEKPDLVILQEIIRINNPDTDPDIDNKLTNLRNYMELIWTSGDMIILPHIAVLSPFKHSLKLVSVHHKSRVVDFTFTHVARGDRKIQIPYFSMNFRAIYAPAKAAEKRAFWTKQPPLLPISWLVGDLNMVMEKNDTSHASMVGHNFRMYDYVKKYIVDHGLIDTHKELNGKDVEHTHYRPTSSSRIDYIFAPPSLLSPHAKAHVIPPGSESEHCLVVLDNERRLGRPNWRLNIEHAKHPVMHSEVARTLATANIDCKNWDIFKHKWMMSFKSFGRKEKKKREDSVLNLTNRLANLLRKPNPKPQKVLQDIQEVKEKLKRAEDKMEEQLNIKSGERWIEMGERSSKYFYRRYKERLQMARIPPLADSEGHIAVTPKEKVETCRKHLQNLWNGSKTKNPRFFPWHCPKLTTDQAKMLASEITEKEVLDSIQSSPRGKAPGPDGFPSEFYRQMKKEMVPHLTQLFNLILNGSRPPPSWSQSHIVQIPKKTENIDEVANWRPITLENCDLKIFSRVLCNRFQQVLPQIIHESQTGFVRGRRIFESVLTIDSVLRFQSNWGYMLSLDWSKAYDRVNFDWLSYALEKFGFPNQITETIQRLFYQRSAKISVDNEEAKINIKQGVPQGDPIAPLLFIIALEPMMAAAREEIEGISNSNGTIHNTAYADDTTFFVQGFRQVQKLEELLKSYSKVSGAVVNWEKSKLTPLSTKPTPRTSAFTLTDKMKPPPTLGFTFPLNKENIDNKWDEIYEWMKKKAWSLNARTLTFAGRALLFNSLVLSKAWYTCSITAPKPEIIKNIQTLAWEFIWGKAKIKPSKETAMLPKYYGGINAPDVELQVQAIVAAFYQHAWNNSNKPWAMHVANTQLRACKRRTFWEAITMRSTNTDFGYNPQIGVKAWRKIQENTSGPVETPSYRSVRELKRLIQPLPKMQTPRWNPVLSRSSFNWNQVFSNDLPPKIQELLWRAAHNNLPTKQRLSFIAPDKYTQNCDMCQGHTENTAHMFEECGSLTTFWFDVDWVCLNMKQRQYRYFRAIAYQAIWFAHIASRESEKPVTVKRIRQVYFGLLEHYRKRTTKPQLRCGWPRKNILAVYFTPAPLRP
jgi:exonuclease III